MNTVDSGDDHRDVTAAELHRRHAAHDRKAKGWRVDLGRVSWRPSGDESADVKRAMALRLAVCWNICEGIPTEALLEGVVRDCFAAAREMAAAVEQEPGLFTGRLRELAAAFKAADVALEAVTTGVDCDCCPDSPQDRKPATPPAAPSASSAASS